MCSNPVGEPVLLVQGNDANLWLLYGNSQANEWGSRPEWRIDTGIKARDGWGYVLGSNPLQHGQYWVYTEKQLTLLDPQRPDQMVTIPLNHAARPGRTHDDRVQARFFTPIVFIHQTDRLACVYPGTDNGSAISPFVSNLDPAANTPIRPTINNYLGIQAAPWGKGFLVISDAGVQLFQSGGTASWNDEQHPAFANSLHGANGWMVAICPTNIDHQTQPDNFELAIWACRPLQGHQDIRLATRTPLPAGTPIEELPPLHAGGNVFIALRKGSQEDAPIIVYPLQILQD